MIFTIYVTNHPAGSTVNVVTTAAPKRRGAHLTPARTEERRQPQRYKSPRVGGSATAPLIRFDASVW